MKQIINFKEYFVKKGDQPEILAFAAQKLVDLSNTNPGTPKHVSMFGGSTVFKLFAYLEEQNLLANLNWSDIHLWWGDERIVPFDSDQSNYGELNRKFLSKLPIPPENIHALGGYDGTAEPEKMEAEVVQIENLTKKLVPAGKDGVPSFDLIYLGIGDDGHTASLFPGCYNPKDDNLWFSTVHPQSFQPRISKTIKLINSAKEICFIAFGENKAKAISAAMDTLFLKLSLLDVLETKQMSPQECAFSSLFENTNSLCSPIEYLGYNTKCNLLLDEPAASLISFKNFLTRYEELKKANKF